jgi:hypothetical protein
MKPNYWWVSVGGNTGEPAVMKDNQLFTLGCPDPFDLTDQTNPVTLLEEIDADDIPRTLVEQKLHERNERRHMQSYVFHRYRKW